MVVMVAATSPCQASPPGYLIHESLFTNWGFSKYITDRSEPLYETLRLSKVNLNVANAKVLLNFLKSSWGSYLQPDTDFTVGVRSELDSQIQQIGLHSVIREQAQFLREPNTNSLMIYLGAHPSLVLCRSLNDVHDLSPHVHRILIVAADQDYKRMNFGERSCSRLKVSHTPFLSLLPAQSSLKDIMTAYLQGFGIHLSHISYTSSYSPDMNNSARLRRHLNSNPNSLRGFTKIIIVAPQPLGEEAWLTVSKYVDPSNTSVHRVFSLPEVDLKDDLMSLRSLLEADINLKNVKDLQ